MIINLFDFITKNKIDIEGEVVIPSQMLENSSIRRLSKISFDGSLEKLVDGSFTLLGKITGTMIIPDDITLEDYEYNFTSEIEEKIDETRINLQKTLDITEDLWQNILVEVPLQAINDKNKNIRLEGEGWRLISEDEVTTSNKPLSSLEDLLRKE